MCMDSLKQGSQTDPGAAVGPCHLLRMSVSVFSFFFFFSFLKWSMSSFYIFKWLEKVNFGAQESCMNFTCQCPQGELC